MFDLRFGRDRAESTTRVYAGELAGFLRWCAGTGRSLEDGARHLSRFVLVLRGTATERPGAGRGRPPGPARINHVLAVVREFFKHAVADGAVDGSVLAALYEVADDRFLPAELRPEGRGLRYRARPRHRLRAAQAARPEAATQAEWEALLEAAACWRDRFVLVLLWFGGLRIGEVLGLRRADLHFAGSSTSLGCREPGPHLHVVHRDANPNRASAKSRNDRVVPVGAWVLAYYDRYAEERLACPAADRCDFVLVNLFHPPLGAPMTASAVRQWFRGLSRRAGLPRAIHPHMLRHSAATALEGRGVASDATFRVRREDGVAGPAALPGVRRACGPAAGHAVDQGFLAPGCGGCQDVASESVALGDRWLHLALRVRGRYGGSAGAAGAGGCGWRGAGFARCGAVGGDAGRVAPSAAGAPADGPADR